MNTPYLEVVGRGTGADGHCDFVLEQMDHQVETDGFLPVNVGVSDGKFPAVSSEHFNLALISRRRHRMGHHHFVLPHKEQKIVAVDGGVGLKQEMPHKQVGPIGGVVRYGETRVLLK